MRTLAATRETLNNLFDAPDGGISGPGLLIMEAGLTTIGTPLASAHTHLRTASDNLNLRHLNIAVKNIGQAAVDLVRFPLGAPIAVGGATLALIPTAVPAAIAGTVEAVHQIARAAALVRGRTAANRMTDAVDSFYATWSAAWQQADEAEKAERASEEADPHRRAKKLIRRVGAASAMVSVASLFAIGQLAHHHLGLTIAESTCAAGTIGLWGSVVAGTLIGRRAKQQNLVNGPSL